MDTQSKNTEPSLMEKVELIRTLIEVMRGGFGKEVHDLAETRLKKILQEL